jgi:hypothetical protein
MSIIAILTDERVAVQILDHLNLASIQVICPMRRGDVIRSFRFSVFRLFLCAFLALLNWRIPPVRRWPINCATTAAACIHAGEE